jgi:Ca2+/Na+ antiporter
MTEYELISLLRETSANVSQDFEFFITITFALIFVSHAVGDKLGKLPRIAVSLLYVAFIVLILSRYQTFLEQAQHVIAQLRQMKSDWPTFDIVLVSWSRRFVFFFGSLAAIFTLFWPVVASNNEQLVDSDT